jgi:hypothetical protein
MKCSAFIQQEDLLAGIVYTDCNSLDALQSGRQGK